MRILITGGSGFVGRNLKEGLQDDYKIFAPSHKELDLLNYYHVEKYIKDKKIDVIINSAVRGGTEVFNHTLQMFLSLIRNIDRVDKIIHFGSGAEYDKTRDMIRVKEKDFGKFVPKDDYGLAKYLISEIIRREKKIVNLRLFGVYGKYEDYRIKFISNVIVKYMYKLPIRIKQNVNFDYLYIDDLIPIVKYFLGHNHQHNAYNISPGKSISLKEIANLVNDCSLYKSKISIDNPGSNYQYTANNTLLKSEVKGIVFTSYKEGIKKLSDYYVKSLKSLDKNAIMIDNFYKSSKIRK